MTRYNGTTKAEQDLARRAMAKWGYVPAGLYALTKARITGTEVGLYDGEPAGLDTEAGRWQTVCEDHGYLVSHDQFALAREWASQPDQWCEECRLLVARTA